MMKRHELKKEQLLHAVENGEFDAEVTASKERVVVIMTQDWCPQWKDMNHWVYNLDISADIDIYEILYNRSDYFKEFMNLKESMWKNDRIPYLRYYKNGTLYTETNYVSRVRFKEIVEG